MIKETIGKYRWTICALLFFATTVNYLDRQVLSLLQPYLSSQTCLTGPIRIMQTLLQYFSLAMHFPCYLPEESLISWAQKKDMPGQL